MQRPKKLKREERYSKRVKELGEEWFHYDNYLVLKDANYGRAEFWKYQLYVLQRDAAFALVYSYSNRHPYFGHRIFRKNGQLVFSSQVIAKAFYLRCSMLFIQACGDKLAQMIRCALGITKWKIRNKNSSTGIRLLDAEEGNTTIKRLQSHLRLHLEEQGDQTGRELLKEIYELINGYLNDDIVKELLECANALKHRWQIFYQGEGLQPIEPRIKKGKSKNGKEWQSLPIGGHTFGKNIEEHIRFCLTVNNLFVEMANKVHHLLNFEKFYEVKNGKRILNLGKR
jgi:hypothetical protein